MEIIHQSKSGRLLNIGVNVQLTSPMVDTPISNNLPNLNT